MTGYLKIKTKIDNGGVDKDIVELENKIKKIQTDNTALDEDAMNLQEEINQYETLCAKADEYKEKIKQLNKEKKSILEASPELNLMDNAEYANIQNKLREIKAEYLQAIEDIEAKYANVNWNKNNKKNQNRAIMRQSELEQTNQTYLPQMRQLLNQRESITVSAPDTSRIDLQIEQMKQKYAQATAEIDKQAPKLDKVEARLSKIKGKQSENNSRIQEFKDKIDAIRVGKVEGQLSNIGKAIQNQIGKIGKMAMGVIGVRTAYNAVRSAISMVSQYNSQVSTDLEYMKYCISNALAPVIQKVVQLLYTALSYINAISTAWFGINLFSNSSAKSFSNMQSSASNTAKSVKEMQKSLQSFDEANVQADSSSTDAGGTKVDMPSMDLSDIQGDIPKWLQWIIDNKALILGTLGAIAGIITAIKVTSFIKSLSSGAESASKIFTKLNSGIMLIVAGIAMLVGSIINMILNWDEMTTKEKVISIALATIGAAFIALGYAIATGISAATLGIGAIIAGVVALVTALGTLIFKWASEEEAILSVADAEANLEEATKNLEEANNSYIDSVDKVEEANQRLAEAEAKCGITGEELFRQVQQGTLDYKDMTAEQKELYKAYLDNETAQKQLEEATNTLMEAKQQEKIASWENKLATMAEAGQYDEYKKAVVDAFNNGELSAEEARDLIGKSMSEMSRDSQKTFMEDLPNDIKEGLDPKNYETTGQKIGKWFGSVWEGIKNVFSHVGDWFKNIFANAWQAVKNVFSTGGKIFDGIKDGILNGLKNVINAIINGINKVIAVPFNGLNSALRTIKNIEILGLRPFNWINTIGVPQIPKLAKGGIISTPTQAIIGEAGREAVVPLENNMEWLNILADKLASKIGTSGGSYIIQMDGRTIQRGIAKRKQELAFSTNGR